MHPHNIEVGDTVLLRQKKIKSQPQYDPKPYSVTEVTGTQITATQGSKVRIRDAQKFKKIHKSKQSNYFDIRNSLNLHSGENEFTYSETTPPPVTFNIPPASPTQTTHRHSPVLQGLPAMEILPKPSNTTSQRLPQTPPQAGQCRYPNNYLNPLIDLTLSRGERARVKPMKYSP